MHTTQKATILIVDDNPLNLQLMGSIIYGKGYNVIFSSSGESALESVSQQSPDLILLDIQMPEKNGFEVCEILKSNAITKDIPIIFLTAITDSEKILRGFELGAVDYITKPFHKEELLARISTHIELKQAREKLANLNENKDKFFSIISHDLRNPAFALKLLLQQMTTKFPAFSKEEILHNLIQLHDASENLYGLLEDLLLWSKSQWGVLDLNSERLNLQAVIDKKIAKCKSAAENKNIEIRSTVSPKVYVNADKMMLKTVILNLLSNAIKFSNQNGIIEVGAITKDKHIEVFVKDSGVGISDEDLNKLFKIDSRVDFRGANKEEINGLGLILCKDFTMRNGGDIFVKSEINKGSTFSFTVKKETD
jgi:two-component system, sensor histidine kinase and response regulator